MESRKAAYEEVHLQTTAKNGQQGCRRDVQRQTVNDINYFWITTDTNMESDTDSVM